MTETPQPGDGASPWSGPDRPVSPLPPAYPATPATTRSSDARSKIIHSLWLVPTILCCGSFTWASFLYVGLSAKKRQWIIAGVGYGAAFIAYFALVSSAPVDPETGRAISNWQYVVGSVMLAVAWFGGAVHALVINRQWLAWRDGRADAPQPMTDSDGSVTPGRLDEPWKSFVVRAMSYRNELNRLISTTPESTVRERLRSIATQFDGAVEQCSHAAAAGQRLVSARARIDVGSITLRMSQLTDHDPDPTRPANTTARDSYARQLDTVHRLDGSIAAAYDSLVTFDAQLSEVVTHATELSARPPDGSGPDGLYDSIESMIIDLTATRLALDEVADLPDRPS